VASDSVAKKLGDALNDPEYLKMLCESQQKEITNLNKKIKALEQQAQESKIKNGLGASVSESGIILNLDDEDGQELICKFQLAILGDRASKCELTLEEARKVEIYSKILNGDGKNTRKNAKELKSLANDDLLKQLEENDDKKAK